MPREGHLDVQPGQRSRLGIADSKDEIGEHKAVEPPFVAQDAGEQALVVAAVLAVDLVIRAHDGCGAGLDAAAEMGQVDLVQRALVHHDIHLEPRPFDAVARVVLDAGHDVALDPAHQGRAHLAQVMGILPVRLLGAAPRPGGGAG